MATFAWQKAKSTNGFPCDAVRCLVTRRLMTTLDRRACLLAALVSALSTTACDPANEHEASYRPGTQYGLTTVMPEGLCLEKTDRRLDVLQPLCTTKFEVVSGPRERADADGKTSCVHTAEYTDPSDCGVVAGRPLFDEVGNPRTATLSASAAWSVAGAS